MRMSTPLCGRPGGAELLGMRPRVGGRPADDLAHLGLAVAVQHRHAEPVHEPARGQRRQRRRDAADVAERRQVGHRRVVGQHHHGSGRQNRRTHLVAVDELGEVRRREAAHEDDGGSGAQAEAHVVDAGVERHRDRDQVRGRLAGGLGAAAVPAQGSQGRGRAARGSRCGIAESPWAVPSSRTSRSRRQPRGHGRAGPRGGVARPRRAAPRGGWWRGHAPLRLRGSGR